MNRTHVRDKIKIKIYTENNIYIYIYKYDGRINRVDSRNKEHQT